MRITINDKKMVNKYLDAKDKVIYSGYASEIDWQETTQFSLITEIDFLREAAWVVLSAGMRESVIRKLFGKVSNAFFEWDNARMIVANQGQCKSQALAVFGHIKKIDAIIEIAERIYRIGYEDVKKRISTEGIDYIKTLPFMGPATSYHFAKNIGLDVAKPDRHLLRIAAVSGFENPQMLCEQISSVVGDTVAVIDIVLWRFATLTPQYKEFFR